MMFTGIPEGVEGDYIDPGFAIFLAITAWILFILIVLAQRQRAKIRYRKQLRQAYISSRREAYIAAANALDDAENEERDKNPQKRDRR